MFSNFQSYKLNLRSAAGNGGVGFPESESGARLGSDDFYDTNLRLLRSSPRSGTRFRRVCRHGTFMKRILIIVIAALIISSGRAHGVVPASANSFQEEDSISSIRRRYAVINKSLARYRVVKKKLSGFSIEGGELIAYFDGAAIVKIVATHYGETGRSLEEFYYWKEQLIFVFGKQDRYDKPMSGKVAESSENRLYFDDGELIRWLNKGAQQVAPSISKYPETQTLYLNTSKLFTEGARSKSSTIEAPDLDPQL